MGWIWHDFGGPSKFGGGVSTPQIPPRYATGFRCGFSDCKTKLDANALFGTFTHRKNRYDINARVTSATYYSQLSKCSHLQLVSWVAKICTNMSRLVANTSQPVNNHYNSNPDTIWTNLVHLWQWPGFHWKGLNELSVALLGFIFEQKVKKVWGKKLLIMARSLCGIPNILGISRFG